MVRVLKEFNNQSWTVEFKPTKTDFDDRGLQQ